MTICACPKPEREEKKPRRELRKVSKKKEAKLATQGISSPRSTLAGTPKSSAKQKGTKQGMMRRSSGVKSRNAKRRESEFARCYGSKERVAFVKSLACVVGEKMRGIALYAERIARRDESVAAWCCSPAIDNAHTANGGKGRKGGADTIVPLCRKHHEMYDQHRGMFGKAGWRATVANAAIRTEAAWQRECARRGTV